MIDSSSNKTNRVLILFAHPRFEKSRVNSSLLRDAGNISGVRIHDLYEQYPDFNIDIEKEKDLLLGHDIIVWHHPVYMYGVPPLLKQWMDMVLEHGWAYGKGGIFLKDKIVFNALTTGGKRDAYVQGGHNGYPIRTFLLPYEQTAKLCNMQYIPPFVVHGTYLLTDKELQEHGKLYCQIINRLAKGDFDLNELKACEDLNEWMSDKGTV